jgi:hypothetical protein
MRLPWDIVAYIVGGLWWLIVVVIVDGALEKFSRRGERS